MPTISIHVPDDVKERLDNHLEYGDSRSKFVTDAVETKLDEEETDES